VLIEKSNEDVQTQEQIDSYFNSNWNNGYRHGTDTMSLLQPAWILSYDIIVKQNAQFILWFPTDSGCMFTTTNIAAVDGSNSPCPIRVRTTQNADGSESFTRYAAWHLTVNDNAATSAVNIKIAQ
jgi:hypothetical protein